MKMPPEVTVLRESSRRNGWSLPPHPLQFVAWIVVIFFVFIYFTTLVPVLTTEWQPAAYIINGLACLVHIISHIIAASLNPADPAVLKKHSPSTPGHFDRRKHCHVIENQYCYLCEVNVGPKSKHCSACNKCIGGFDHHCKWLNNCVGVCNYKWFLSTLVSGLLGTIMLFCVSLVVFIGYFIDEDSGKMLDPYKESSSLSSNVSQTAAVFKIVYQPVIEEAWLGIVAATGILGLLALVLLVHLFTFHAYLICKGMSTYDYIVRSRERDSIRNADEEPKYATPKSSFRNKGNRITPSTLRTSDKSDVTDGVKRSKRDRSELREYRKSLAEREELEDSETSPTISSPIKETDRFDNKNTNSETTKIKKLKRRKRKSLPELDKQEIATIGNKDMYKTDIYNEKPLRKSHSTQQRALPIPKNQLTDDSDTAESVEEINHNKSLDRQSHDSGAYMTAGYSNHSSPDSLHPTSPNINNNMKKRNKKKKPTPHSFSDDESINELNATTMFTVNESAKLNPDGSLDYTNRFQTLPLTPVQIRKRHNEIPPLDLSTLRSSTESQNTFKPYSGGLRDSDTYRFLERDRSNNTLLKSVPEAGSDVVL